MHPAKLQRLLQETATQLQAGRLEAASRLCTQARAMAPRDFAVLQLSGAVGLRQERFPEAAGWLAAAVKLQPGSASAARRLGFALAKLGRYEEAEAALQSAVKLAPEDAESWDTLGFVRKARGQLADAIAAHRRAVALQPGRAHSWYNLGHALIFTGAATEALACHERALAADPAFAKAHYGRALALQLAHRIPEAVAAFGEALRGEPGLQAAGSHRLMALNYLDEITAAQLAAEHARFGESLGAPAAIPLPARTPDPERRLRVAFLSPDLREHSVAYFIEPLLANLDPARFEVALYHDHFVVDETSTRLRRHAAIWRNFVGQSPADVEAAVRRDAPDILVDLAGHTGLNRLASFARRLAPVQVSYLGYPNTTGLRAMDYRLVDAITDPVGEADARHTEKLIRFSPCAWSYLPRTDAPRPQDRPASAGAPVTFGCFNNFAKVTDQALRAWARLLAAVPGSRLRLKATGLDDAAIAAQIRGRLDRAALPAERVELLGPTASAAAHLALYHGVDLALDTFPYHGTTTTCEALAMGVPVITLAGDRHASRVGASLLAAVGQEDCVAADWDHYVRRAQELVGDPAALTVRSRGLVAAFRASPLLDHAGQAARFGAALRGAWANWCAAAVAAS